VQHRDDRLVLLLVPAASGFGPAQVRARILHEPKRPGLDVLGELGVVPRVAADDPRRDVVGERDALAEEPLVALDDDVAAVRDPGDRDLSEDLGHVRLDDGVPERQGDRHAVVTIADEMQVADTVDGDRRHPPAAALRHVDPLPALAKPVRRGPEAAVEVGGAIDAPDDAAKLDRLQPDPSLTRPAEGGDDLVERQDQIDVVGLAAQPPREPRQHLAPPRALKVALGVDA
jgi:hypothetical protein